MADTNLFPGKYMKTGQQAAAQPNTMKGELEPIHRGALLKHHLKHGNATKAGFNKNKLQHQKKENIKLL